MCSGVCLLEWVCIFRVTERVGVGNRERSYISLLHNELLLRSADKRKNKKDVSHLWHIYLDRRLTQSCLLPCWDILVREQWDTKWRAQSKTAISLKAIEQPSNTASIFPVPRELISTFLWIESEKRQSQISHSTFSRLFSALNLNDHFWG